MTDTPPAAPARRGQARPWLFLGAGVALAAILAVVLFGVVGVGSSSNSLSTTQAEATQPNLEPGINAPTTLLLDLTVFPKSSHQQAPAFTLTDQYGHKLSPAEFKGKVLVITPNDDQCTDVCTLMANDIVIANKDLGPAAKDVVWLSVNANPFYPQVKYTKAWTDEHGLANQTNWYYGTGAPKVLAQVWKNYGFQVILDHKNRTVTHSTEIFFMNPAGTEKSVADFGGVGSASTAQFGHGLAQMADDLLPGSEQVHVAGPEVPAPTNHNATINAVLPDFTLPYLEKSPNLQKSTDYSLKADHGHYVVINFWASTCTICKTELPGIEAAYKNTGKWVDFVGVDESDPSSSSAVAMAKKAGLSYPLVADKDGVAAGGEQITGLPYTVIISPKGIVQVRHPGAFTNDQLTYTLQMLDSSVPDNVS
jgi:cytochrome oxidase Cu insertion factor (SCO1/SenC/PrrC family)/thiol-disulfide isomerase/thioredoxin